MATVEQVEMEVLEPMKSLYRVPHGIDDPARALVEYVKVLTRFGQAELSEGWQRIIATHKRRDWPTIWDIQEAIKFTQPAPARPIQSGSVERFPFQTPEAKARVARMTAIVRKHGSYADAIADPDFQAIEDEMGVPHAIDQMEDWWYRAQNVNPVRTSILPTPTQE